MPRRGTIAADIESFLGTKSKGASAREIREALDGVRRSEVLPHSVRSALYQHLDDQGDRLFVRVGRAKYALRK
jgi:hypothetical protein